jgi:hypothetical protein
MSDQQPAPAPEQTPQQAPASTTVSDLTSLLTEFDTATKAPAEAKPVEARPAATKNKTVKESVDPTTVDWNDPKALHEYLNQPIDPASAQQLRQQVGALGGMVKAMYQNQVVQQDQSDFENIVGRASKMLREAELPVSDDFARRWLIAEARLEPGLADAFERRNHSAEHQRRFQRLEKKAMERLLSAARLEPDQQATADRAAVIAAVRGTAKYMSEAPPVRYGDLNDAEFRAELKKHGL